MRTCNKHLIRYHVSFNLITVALAQIMYIEKENFWTDEATRTYTFEIILDVRNSSSHFWSNSIIYTRSTFYQTVLLDGLPSKAQS